MFKVLFSQLKFYGECCATHVLGKTLSIGFVGFDHFDGSLGFNGKIESSAKYKVVLACWLAWLYLYFKSMTRSETYMYSS